MGSSTAAPEGCPISITSLWSSLKRIYSLDVLDTRFTVSSSTPIQKSSDVQGDPAKASVSRTKSRQDETSTKFDDTMPALWRTREFYVYGVFYVVVIPWMIWTGISVSQPSHPTYKEYEHLLSPGWLFGRKVDNSDAQYASFRGNITSLAIVMLVHLGLRWLYDSFFRIDTYTRVSTTSRPSANGVTQGLPSHAAADARLEHRVTFDFYFAIMLTIVLHGFSSLKILLIMYANYKLAKNCPRPYLPAATWICNLGMLFANELSRGYEAARIAQAFFPIAIMGSNGIEYQAPEWAKWIDSHGGLVPRWEVLFNITVLRLISFNLDYYWSRGYQAGNPDEVSHGKMKMQTDHYIDRHKKKQLDLSNLSERDRVATPARPADYSLRNYIAYTLYSPLYLAGPILTFNDYVSQQRYPPASITRERTAMYAFRLVVILLCMEVVLHSIYAVAIFSVKPDWSAYTPYQLSMLGYFNLHIIWLKLLVPWRFFRLWALLDGNDPPENMARCMTNNYSVLAFWRAWHRSYNRWVVRYIHVPIVTMGGRTFSSGIPAKIRQAGSFLTVFTFVAVWHDINLRLLAWGWLITLFALPQIFASLAFPANKWRSRPAAYRVLCGIGGVFNIFVLMIANLVGFAIGLDGMKGLLQGIVGTPSGRAFVAVGSVCTFVAIQVMFEIREGEKRDGIRMKC